MAWIEDPSVFLADFGVPVIAGAVQGAGILDTPGQLTADGMAITTEYTLLVESSKFGTLSYGTAVTVNSVAYTVRENLPTDDGTFCQLILQKT